MSNFEPPLNPPVDELAEQISEKVDAYSYEELSIEIVEIGLVERAKKDLIFHWVKKIEESQEAELSPKGRKLISDLFDWCPFKDIVCEVLDKDAIGVIKEMLSDYLYNKEENSGF